MMKEIFLDFDGDWRVSVGCDALLLGFEGF